jgi:hypothetical protein
MFLTNRLAKALRIILAFTSKVSNPKREDGADGLKNGRATDALNGVLYIFRSYDHWSKDQLSVLELNAGPAHTVPIWQVACATTAEPMYFEGVRFADRQFGLSSSRTSNPIEEIFAEVFQMSENGVESIGMLLSIASGMKRPVSRFQGGRFAKYQTYFNAIKSLSAYTESTHARMKELANMQQLPYFRFNITFRSGPLDKMRRYEWSSGRSSSSKGSTPERLAQITEKYCNMDDTRAHLREVAKILVDERRARKQSEHWDILWRNVIGTGG